MSTTSIDLFDGITSTAPAGAQLTADDARHLTDDIKRDVHALWAAMLRAYNGGAHTALGYTNWHDYCAAEFGIGKSRSYQLLDAGRVHSTIVESNLPPPSNEAVARELVPLLNQPERVVEVYAEVVESAPRVVTAVVVRDAVQARTRPTRRDKPQAHDGLDDMVEWIARGIRNDLPRERILKRVDKAVMLADAGGYTTREGKHALGLLLRLVRHQLGASK